MTKPVRVQVLYFGGCPHWRLMDERVQAAAAERGLDVERVLVESDDAVQHVLAGLAELDVHPDVPEGL
jgi:hypothetical protein